jgi:glycosyltransferase involved in cell wall biosynthesis
MKARKPKVVYIISDIEKSLGFEWTLDALNEKVTLSCVLIGKANTKLEAFLQSKKISAIVLNSEEINAVGIWLRLFSILYARKPDVVHCHLWRATILGISVSWLLSVPKRIFTRHHALIHYLEIKSGRKWDVLCNHLATDIVAISNNIKSILIEKDGADPRKIHLIHHGFDLEYFKNVSSLDIEKLRSKYSIHPSKQWPVIGVVSRYLDWKGIQYIIPAFLRLQVKYPKAHLVLANAKGNYSIELRAMLRTLPDGSYTEIVFEECLAGLYRLFDLYVHAPINSQVEAFGQTYVESLASGVPSIFTLSGIASEFIRQGENALIANFAEPASIYSNLEILLENSDLRRKLQSNGPVTVSIFDKTIMISKLLTLYSGLNENSN